METTRNGSGMPAGKAHALTTILGWSTLWICGALAATTDPGQPALMTGYAIAAFAGLCVGTRSYLTISREVR